MQKRVVLEGRGGAVRVKKKEKKKRRMGAEPLQKICRVASDAE